MNRASTGKKGNSGRSGVICPKILSFSVQRERGDVIGSVRAGIHAELVPDLDLVVIVR